MRGREIWTDSAREGIIIIEGVNKGKMKEGELEEKEGWSVGKLRE